MKNSSEDVLPGEDTQNWGCVRISKYHVLAIVHQGATQVLNCHMQLLLCIQAEFDKNSLSETFLYQLVSGPSYFFGLTPTVLQKQTDNHEILHVCSSKPDVL